jgi:hypothetical protein
MSDSDKIDSSHESGKNLITWAWPTSTTIIQNNPVLLCAIFNTPLYIFKYALRCNTKNIVRIVYLLLKIIKLVLLWIWEYVCMYYNSCSITVYQFGNICIVSSVKSNTHYYFLSNKTVAIKPHNKVCSSYRFITPI